MNRTIGIALIAAAAVVTGGGTYLNAMNRDADVAYEEANDIANGYLLCRDGHFADNSPSRYAEDWAKTTAWTGRISKIVGECTFYDNPRHGYEREVRVSNISILPESPERKVIYIKTQATEQTVQTRRWDNVYGL